MCPRRSPWTEPSRLPKLGDTLSLALMNRVSCSVFRWIFLRLEGSLLLPRDPIKYRGWISRNAFLYHTVFFFKSVNVVN